MAGWDLPPAADYRQPDPWTRQHEGWRGPAEDAHPASAPGRTVASDEIRSREIGGIAGKIAAGFLQGSAVVGDAQNVGPGNQRAG